MIALGVLWASPWTAFGLLLGVIGLLLGGKAARKGRTLVFWGAGLSWVFRHLPVLTHARAVTFGHVVLARSRRQLEAHWEHEFVHVRQYERWGPLMVPAYLACRLALWLRGRHPYLDNPFEKEAFEATGFKQP